MITAKQTAVSIDEEVRKFDHAGLRPREKHPESENREALIRIAEALLERESLDAAEIKLLIAGQPLEERRSPRSRTRKTKNRLRYLQKALCSPAPEHLAPREAVSGVTKNAAAARFASSAKRVVMIGSRPRRRPQWRPSRARVAIKHRRDGGQSLQPHET